MNRLRAVICLVILCSLALLAQTTSSDLYYGKNLKQYYTQAASAFGKQDYPSATVALHNALEVAPNHAPTLWELAQIQAAAGAKADMLRTLEQLATIGAGYDPRGHQLFTKYADDADFKRVADAFDRSTPKVSNGTLAFTIDERDIIPEGVAYDPVSKTLFVSSIFKHKIIAVDAQGRARDFKKSGEDGLLEVLGMKVDPDRRLLWVADYADQWDKEHAGQAAVHKYDLRNGTLIKRYALPGTPAHLFNDVAFTASGDLYVTDSTTGAVYLIRHDKDELEEFLPANTFFYCNGIATTPDGSRLFVASWGPGISIVDTKTKKITQLAQPANVTHAEIDGLYLYKNSLIGVQNGLGNDRVTRFYLNDKGDAITRAEVLESRNPYFDIPTTGALDGGTFYLLANAQLRRQSGGKIVRPTDPIRILRIPLK